MKFTTILTAATLLAGGAQAAALNTILFKLTDSGNGALEALSGWNTAGAVNEGAAGALGLTNNGVDYRNALIDTNWGDFRKIRTSMYRDGREVAYIEFNAAGTTAGDFFDKANVVGSSWTDLTSVKPYNYFSIEGHASIDRHFFVNNNYGGCSRDVGHFLVLDGRAGVCSWEYWRSDDVGSNTVGFLYANASTQQNWGAGAVGVADTFVISTDYGDNSAVVPLPAPAALLIGGLAALGLARRRG